MDMVMHHGHGHAPWTRIWLIDMAYARDMNMVMQYGLGPAAWTWTCSMDRDMQRRHVQAVCAMNIRVGIKKPAQKNPPKKTL